MLQRMVGGGCCTEPAEASVVETHNSEVLQKCAFAREMLEKTVVEKCWKRVLCNVGEERCRDVL